MQICNGDDIRHHSAYKQWCGIDLADISKIYNEDELSRPLGNLRICEYYSDIIFSIPNQSVLAVRPYMHSFLPLQLDKYESCIPGREIPVIVHAPSSQDIKGTKIILNTLDQLREEGISFELRLLEKMNNKRVIAELKNADIAIDQLYILLYGMFPVEAMASGCAVATVDEFNGVREPIPSERPVYHIDEINLKAQLRQLLIDKNLRRKLAESGEAFVRKFHDSSVVAQRIQDLLQTDDLKYDYYPEFFIGSYVPPENAPVPEELNFLTAKVIEKYGLPGSFSEGYTGKNPLALEALRIIEKEITYWPGKSPWTAQNKSGVRFSICIPTYNRSALLRESVLSALAQDHQNFEIIVVDDGSDDETESVMRDFAPADITYIKKEHSGAPETRNLAVKTAAGDFIVWLADDDLLGPDALKTYDEYINAYPDADLYYCCMQQINSNGDILKQIRPKDWYHDRKGLLSSILVGTPFPDGGSAIRKKVYQKIGGYNPDFKRAQDYEFWSRVVTSKLFEAKLVDKSLYTYRIHGSNITGILTDRTDYSYEARIINRIASSVPMNELYSELDWNSDERNSYAEAFYLTALKLLSFNDLESAKSFYRKSLNFNPELAFRNGKINEILNVPASEGQNGNVNAAADTKYPVIPEFIIENDRQNNLIADAEKNIMENNLQEASRILKFVLMNNPENTDALNDLSVVEILNKKYSEAINLIERVLKIKPDCQTALDNVKYISELIDPK